ncbi:MAG: hypothetical protein ABF633_03045 [Clostridium sp.]|uniref:hypothetical protein n=1 Tax=Clostridium sp. TaxID=1506 RepID=UPI0039EA3108
MVYNISYDLSNPGQKYEKLHKLIVEVSNNRWSHALDSTYIVQSNKTSKQIHDHLSAALDANDNIFICEIKENYAGVLDKDHWPYIENLF